jgi:hypothetical protein
MFLIFFDGFYHSIIHIQRAIFGYLWIASVVAVEGSSAISEEGGRQASRQVIQR